MKSLQRGASMPGILLMLLGAVAVLTLAVKLIPAYIDNWTLDKALERVAEDREVRNLSNREIGERIQKQLNIEGLTKFDMNKVRIQREQGRLQISAEYEVRTPIVHNIDAVISFKNHREVAL